MDFTTSTLGPSTIDPFIGDKREHVHLHMSQQGRKKKTSISGLVRSADELNIILRKLKRDICNCNGSIDTDDDGGSVIILFGDQRETVRKYLLDTLKISYDDITVHGA